MRPTALLLLFFSFSPADAIERPNILWISCEDISPHLGCYGDTNATTPNLDKLAEGSVRYTRAFTVHGVCAPCRTGIITGMYPMGIGANHMRSRATLPDHIKCFPYYLRQAGYYCTNNSKTDYNFHWVTEEVWDESSNKAHWKNRTDKSQPFFAVFNMTMTHESKIWPGGWKNVIADTPADELHDPDKIEVPDLYPDTPDIRSAYARLLDIITVMDRKAGQYLAEIEEAGLTEDTIVIFWSDHGNGFARAKRWIYDSGTLVPMMARVPEKWRTDGQAEPGSVSDQLINLIDLGPTVLNLADVAIPDHMFGQPFLGRNLPAPRKYIHGARDRIDERFDMVRSVRDGQFRYVRNYHTWRPALQHIEYAENSVTRKEMRRLSGEGKLAPESEQFLKAPRAPEELYDLHADPWELSNLAHDSSYTQTLRKLRVECDRWQNEVRDVHLIPEIILAEEEYQVGNRWQILHRSNGLERLKTLNTVAKTANAPTTADVARLVEWAKHDDAAVRWWAVTGLVNAFDRVRNQKAVRIPLVNVVESAIGDRSAAVRIVAAGGLHRLGRTDEAIRALTTELQDTSEFVQHAAILAVDELGPAGAAAKETLAPLADRKGYIGNLARHALSQYAR